MKGEDVWLAEGRMDLGLTPDDFKTHFITSESRRSEPPKVAAAS